MKAIIIEDEKRAANRLQRLIEEQASEIEVLEIFESVRESVEYLKGKKDLQVIFADIQLADGLSFEIFEQVKVDCPVIFTTAYDQYAIKAFKNNGIDYLLKPIEESELKQSIDKLQSMVQSPSVADLMAIAAQLKTGKVEYRSRFMVKVGQKLKSISVEEISAVYSENKGTFLQCKEGRSYLIEFPLEQVEEMLSKKDFFRISRKYMVAITGIEEILMWSNSRLKLTVMGSKDPEIVVARERTKDFKAWLES